MPNTIKTGGAATRAHPHNGATFALALIAHVGFTGYLLFLHHPLWEALAAATSAVLVAAYVTRVVVTGIPPLAFTARSLVARTVLSWVKQGVAEQLPPPPAPAPTEPPAPAAPIPGQVVR